MGLLSFLYDDLAVDLGTANTLIARDGEIVLNEPSVIAIRRDTNKVIAVGNAAMQMHEKTHDNIKTVRPLKDGVIADFHAAEHMILGMIKMIARKRFGSLSPFAHRVVICIPSGITDVEKRAVRDSAEHTGAKEVYLIHEPIAAAIGIGIDIEAPVGSMIVDIGGGTTEIAVIALSGIVCDQSIKIAGDVLNNDISDHMRRAHNLLIGERTAEKIKMGVGAVMEELENPPEPFEVRGRDLMSGIPKVVRVTHREIAAAVEKSILKIEDAVLKALEMSPPELSADIYESGIHLTGGGALLRGLSQRLAKKTELNVHVAKEPLQAVVRGTSIALKSVSAYKSVLLT